MLSVVFVAEIHDPRHPDPGSAEAVIEVEVTSVGCEIREIRCEDGSRIDPDRLTCSEMADLFEQAVAAEDAEERAVEDAAREAGWGEAA